MTNQLRARPGSNEDHDEAHLLETLRVELSLRVESRRKIEVLMERFTGSLFTAFESAVEKAQRNGIPGLLRPRRLQHPAGEWRQALQLFIEDWTIIIVPLVGAAWPNPRDEARISPSKFKEPCGRIALFLGDDPQTDSFYDFLIFADGSWFAWGYGWPRLSENIDDTEYDLMAFELLTSFVRDIHTTWRPRRVTTGQVSGTQLSQSLDAKKRVYNFGLPGEE